MRRQRWFLLGIVALSAMLLLDPATVTQAQRGRPQPPQPPPDPAIAFTQAGNFGLREDIYVMNADGSNQTLVLAGAKGLAHHTPNWSPDGMQLAFVSDVQGSGVYVINRDGTNLRKVVALNANAYDLQGPAWSPVPSVDGKFKLAYSDRPLLPDGTLAQEYVLFLVNLDGTEKVQLTFRQGDVADFFPSWSPLANRLAIERAGPGTADETFVLELGLAPDGAVTVISETDVTSGGPLAGAFLHSAEWAKTQDKIVVMASINNDRDLWVIDLLNPSNPVNLTNTLGGNESWPSWSPDDSRIVFQRFARKSSGTYIINANGTGLVRIADAFPELNWRRNP